MFIILCFIFFFLQYLKNNNQTIHFFHSYQVLLIYSFLYHISFTETTSSQSTCVSRQFPFLYPVLGGTKQSTSTGMRHFTDVMFRQTEPLSDEGSCGEETLDCESDVNLKFNIIYDDHFYVNHEFPISYSNNHVVIFLIICHYILRII